MLILTYESISELNGPFQEINMYVEPEEQELQAHYKHYLLFEWLILKLSIGEFSFDMMPCLFKLHTHIFLCVVIVIMT